MHRATLKGRIEMKKLYSVLLALAILATLCLSALAAPGGFVESPTGNESPVLISGRNESEDCPAGVLVTPYTHRDRLTKHGKSNIEEAYRSIAEAEDLLELMPALKGIEVDGDVLAVSDLFDLSLGTCDLHNVHGDFIIKVDFETIDRFEALMHWEDEKWTHFEDCYIDEEGYLCLTTHKSGAFAIVVNADASTPEEPVEEEECCLWIYIVIIVVCLLALIIFLIVMKKKKKKKA